MKIALIGQKGAPTQNGGIERYTENLATNLVNKGVEVLLYSRRYYSRGVKEYKGVRIISLPSIKSKNLEAITNTFFACLDVAFRKVDAINFQAIGPASLIWLAKLLKPRTPIIFTFHCQDYYHKKWGRLARWYLKFGERVGCRLADKVIVTSRVLSDYVKKTYGFEPIYIPYGAYAQEKTPVRDIRRWGLEEGNYVSYIGRLVRHKNVHLLIQAFKQIKTDKKLVIVGGSAYTDEYVQELYDLAKDDNRIIFTDNQSGLVLNELFSNSYAFIQPSEYEGLSVALLEAMGWGLACLTSDIPQMVEGLNGTGLTFRNGDVKDLQDKLTYMLDNPEKAKEFGRAASKRVNQEYNWNTISDDIKKLYQEVITEKKR
ncbi:MAG: glycosyltransferase family 4 protein [Patescibacteria group bacterium]|jgi:glycosyltransferase involved in cell wall biosynthesis